MKSLQIHIFVDHQNIKTNTSIGQGPPNKVAGQPSPNGPPLAPPPLQSHSLIRTTMNGHHFQTTADVIYRRQTSSSSELSDSPSPSLPSASTSKTSFSCDLCGMAGIVDRVAFKQVKAFFYIPFILLCLFFLMNAVLLWSWFKVV
jgi:hypothetical protein